MGTGKFSGKHNEMQGANFAMDRHPIQGGNSNTPSHLKKSRKAVGSFGLSTDFKFFSLPEFETLHFRRYNLADHLLWHCVPH